MSSFARAFLIIFSSMCFMAGSLLYAQLSAGTIVGAIHGLATDDVGMIRVRLEEASTSTTVAEAAPDQSGTFTFRNVPFAAYDVSIVQNNLKSMQQRVIVRSAVPVVVTFDSMREYKLEEITVEALPQGISPMNTSMTAHSFYTATSIAQLPTATGNKAIESILLNTPGVVPDEDGRLHVRGEDAQLQYVVDGIPITGNLTRVYSSLFNAELIKSVDIQTGGLNAEYGVATSGVLAITTKSGFDAPLFSRISGSFGSFNNREGLAEVGGNMNGKTALYVAASKTASDRYLDPITKGDPNHDDSDAESFFGKLNTIFTDKIDLSILGMYDKTEYSIPNQFVRPLPQDQRQVLDDYMIGARLNAQVNESSVLSALVYNRQSRATITSGGLMQLSNPADVQKAMAENEKLFIGGKRKYTTTGGQIEFSSRTDWFSLPNNFKIGIGGEVTPTSEFFTFGVTDSTLSGEDSLGQGGDARYEPYDLTKGGTPFLANKYKKGNRFSGYVQDEIQSGRWTFNLGVRFDAFKLIESESAVSPRVAAAYALNENLVLRASYNRIVMQAPIENYLVSSSAEAGALVEVGGPEQGNVPINVRSEKAHVLEIGGAYRLNRFFDFDLSGYGKFIDDFIVKVELGNSGVIFPVNLKQGMVAGGELRARLHDWNGLSGFLSFSTCVSRGLVPDDGSTPFGAGLVLGEEGESYSNPFKGEDSFPTEHNQLLTAAFGITYQHPTGPFATIGGRFDSGLPFDLEGPNGQALDAEQSRAELKRRGYSDDVIDLLELEPETAGSPDRSVAPHAIFDVAVGYDVARVSKLPLKLTVTMLNVFDTAYLYKFESTFGGTHFGQPRIVAVRLDLKY